MRASRGSRLVGRTGATTGARPRGVAVGLALAVLTALLLQTAPARAASRTCPSVVLQRAEGGKIVRASVRYIVNAPARRVTAVIAFRARRGRLRQRTIVFRLRLSGEIRMIIRRRDEDGRVNVFRRRCTPPPPPPPAAPPVAAAAPQTAYAVPSGGRIGVVTNRDGTNGSQQAALAALRAPIVRDEFDLGEPTASFRAAAERVKAASGDGSGRLNLLLSGGLGGDAARVGQIARELGPGLLHAIELGNEESYRQPGGGASHARYCRAAVAAARGSGVPVLCQLDDGFNGDTWWNGLFSEGTFVPDGWVVHVYPYGSGWDVRWPERLQRHVDEMTRRGVAAPIHITETGLPTDGGAALFKPGGAPAGGYSFERSTEIVRDLAAQTGPGGRFGGVVRSVLLYQVVDQRPAGSSSESEHFFGIFRHDGVTPKGPYTAAVRELTARR